jgi:hypothetical protein
MGRPPAAALLLAAALLAPVPARAEGGAAEEAKRFREAFLSGPGLPEKLGPPGRVEKEATALLPGGIVVEAGPFDLAVKRLRDPVEERMALRERAMGEAGMAPGSGADIGKAVAALEKENAEFAARIAAVEASYAEVYDAGYMESGEKQHRARKLAAVLIPLYRSLALRNAAVAARGAGALARSRDPARLQWVLSALADASPAVRAAAAGASGLLGGPADPAFLAPLRTRLRDDAVPAVRAASLSALLRFRLGLVAEDLVAALADPAWEVRALAAAACARGKVLEATDALVRALEKEGGRLQMELDDALRALHGVSFVGDAALWRRWLDENRPAVEERTRAAAAGPERERPLGPPETWEAPGAAEVAGDGKARNPTSSFYGIETTSRRVLFVVDISRSMEEPAVARPPTATGGKDDFPSPKGNAKMDVARWQLHRAVAALPKDALFNVVVFSESYKSWQDAMVETSPAAKGKAHAFIDGLKANGVTNIADSLDEAFDLAGAGPLAVPGKGAKGGQAVDTVYLLSDGNPNRGRLSDLPALLEDAVARARASRIVIHAIGIGEVAGSEFLKSLAARTGGRYVGFK